MKTTKSIITVLFVLLTAQIASAYYCPSTGRWLSRDPIGEPGFQVLQITSLPPQLPGRWINRDSIGEGGGLNLYGFINNNSISQIDRFGLDKYPHIDEVWTGSPGTKKKVPGGEVSLDVVFVDASLTETLQSYDSVTYQKLQNSLAGSLPTTYGAKVNTPDYIGSGFVMKFTKNSTCTACDKFEWVQMKKSPGYFGGIDSKWSGDYDWTSASGANSFTAADFPGNNYGAFKNSNDTWQFDLRLYCVAKDGTKLQIYQVMWSSQVIVTPANNGVKDSANVVLDIGM